MASTLPTNITEMRAYIRRRLGEPVTCIDVDDEQINDRICDALSFWRDYHYNATQRTFLKHQLTATDISNEYITLPEDVLEVIRVINPGSSIYGNALFNVKYHIMLSEVFNLIHGNRLNYYMAMRNLNEIDEILGNKYAYRFNRYDDKIYLDTDWSVMPAGQYIIFEAYLYIAETNNEIWGDRWLLKYATALVKRQWGMNLIKFQNFQILAGLQFNATEILQQAEDEITKLEDEIIEKYSLPPMGLTA